MLPRISFLKVALSFVITSALYLFFINLFDEILSSGNHYLGKTFLEYLVVDGGGAFLGFVIGLLIIPRVFRAMFGILFMNFLFAVNLILDIYPNKYEYMPLFDSLVRLSFTAIGCMMAIYLWVSISASAKAVENNDNNASRLYNTSTSLFMHNLSFISVPLTYCSLFIFMLAPLCINLWLLVTMKEVLLIFPLLILFLLISFIIAIKMIRSVFFFRPHLQPALAVDFFESKTLYEFTKEACNLIDVDMPDAIVLDAEPNIYVEEGHLNTFDRIAKGRVLVVGVPLMKVLNANEFKAMLCCELAQFTGRDRYYSSTVYPLFKKISSTLDSDDFTVERRSIREEKSHVFNLVFIIPEFFVRMFSDYYKLLDRFLVGGRILRADRIAAMQYGTQIYASALVKRTLVADFFSKVATKLPFSEDNFFERFNRLVNQIPKDLQEYEKSYEFEKSTRKSAIPSIHERLKRLPEQPDIPESGSSMRQIEEELYLLEDRLSLIYQYSRNINKYYDDLNRLLLKYRGPEFRGKTFKR